MEENFLDKKKVYSFFIFLVIFSGLVLTNYSIHFPNDGVKYIFDVQTLISRFDLFYDNKVILDYEKPFLSYYDGKINYLDKKEIILNSNFPTIQVGIVAIIFFLRIFLGDLWFVGYIILISLINSILFREFFKLKKIFKISSPFFLIFLILFYSNFEFLKTSKSFYNEAIYIPLLYIFIIRLFEILNLDKFELNFNFWLLLFLFLGIFFRFQHLAIIFSLIFLFFIFKLKIIKLSHYFIAYIFCFISILIYMFYVKAHYVMLNDLSFFVSFSNINKIIDSSKIKQMYMFYVLLITFVSIFIYQINSYFKEKNKIAIFITIYLSLNFIFLLALIINDERYYLLAHGVFILLLVDFFDKQFSSIKIKKTINIMVFIFSLLVIFQSFSIYNSYKKTKTYLTLSLIDNTLIKNNYIYKNKLIFCEIDRICAWKYYINSLDTKKIFKYNAKNLNKIKLNEYHFIGSKEEIKNIDFKIIAENEKIVFAKIYNEKK